jgi:multiple sugar transport system substrate-binding protein
MRKLGRRDFLRSAGAGAAGLGAFGLFGRSSAFANATSRLSPPSSGGASLNMRIWGAFPDFVASQVNAFQSAYGDKVDLGVIAGDYPALVQNLLRQKTKLDMFYGLRHLPAGWLKAGWIKDYEQFWAKDDAVREMLPAVRDALTVDGKLVGLPYFAFVNGALFANTEVLKKANLEGQYPKTYDELYKQVRLIKQRGASDTPYLPSFWGAPWYGIPFGLVQEALNRKIPLFGDGGRPLFDEKSEVVEMLKQWKALYNEGLVPKGILTFQESDWIETFAKGGIAYSPQLQYDIKTFSSPDKSQVVGKIVPVPQQGQNWGMLHVGGYLIGNYGQDDAQLAHDYDLAQHFGYRDRKSKEFDVPKAWATNYYLTQGYAAVNESKEVQETVAKWLPDPETNWPILKDYLANPQSADELFHTLWSPAWMAYASQELPKAVNGDEAPEKVVVNLRAKAESLIEQYQ